MKKKYSSILATEGHKIITDMKEFSTWDGFSLGFFLNDKEIGYGWLKKTRYHGRKSLDLQTESTGLKKVFRKKGHGIHLYHALIAQAKKCGARRVYSSQSLNKFSKRMWSEKLKEFYDVKTVTTIKPCGDCGHKSRRPIGYYIVLKGK